MTKARKARKARSQPVVTLPQSPWDEGAMGPANRHRLRREPATEIDPETGKETPNPNNVKRMRRVSWVAIYEGAGYLNHRQAAAAERLRMAADGMPDRDPLAALDAIRVRGGGDMQAARIDARRLFRELWADVPQASKPVLERVVIEDKAIWSGGGIAARDRHIKRLCEGLDAIA